MPRPRATTGRRALSHDRRGALRNPGYARLSDRRLAFGRRPGIHAADRSDRDISASIPALGPVRSTKPRVGDRPDPTKAFTEVAKSVRAAGLLDRDHLFYVLLATGLLTGLGGAIAGFVLLGDSWFQLLIAGALGLLFTQAAFLAHEASHRSVMTSGPANDRVGRLVAVLLVGMSYQWWMGKHTRHHGNPNQVGKDPDIAPDFVVFTADDAAAQRGPLAALVRRQAWLFYPLLLLEGLNLHVHSFRSLFARGEVKGRWFELGLLALRFGVYFGAIFWVLPLGMAFAFIGVQMAVFGLYMGTSFAVNHIGMPVIPAEARLDFLRKQVLTARNGAGGFWASVLLGGLNYQVEHHLFPNMARTSLARARLLVREHCRTLDIPYTEMSLGRAHVQVLRYLGEVGLAARDPWVCPPLAALRRG